MSYNKLSILKPGQTFSIGDAVFILLEHGKDTTKALVIENAWTGQPVGIEQPFDAHESNYKLSELRRDIESEDYQGWLENEVGAENLVEHTVSLTTVDGQNDYGELTCKVRPITFDEARKYNNLIVNKDLDDWWWTCTAWTSPNREYNRLMAVVRPSGFVFGYCNLGHGVRPVFILKSNIFVSKGE